MTVEGERPIERRPVSRIALTAATALCFAAVLAIGGASVAAADHLDDATEADVAAWPTADDGEISAAESPDSEPGTASVAASWSDGVWGGDGFWGDDDDDDARTNDTRDDGDWNHSDGDRDWNHSDDDRRDDADDDGWDDGFWDDGFWGDDDDDDSRDDDTPTDTPDETPTDTPDETPTDTPGDDPTDTPDDTPTDTPGDGDDDEDSDDGNETNNRPDADINAPDTVDAGEAVVLSAAGSTDDGVITEYEWTLGDDATAAGENVSHTYATAGNYTVTLTVTDDDGATDNATTTIQVEDSSEDDGFDEQEVERRMHEQINEIRESEGLEPLNHDDALRPIAGGHSEDMAVNDYFSHTSPDGDSFVDRYDEAGYDCSLGGGENIAMTGVFGEPSEDEIATQFVDMWMNSEGHRQNVLTERWNNEGIGVYYDSEDGEVYATQNFC